MVKMRKRYKHYPLFSILYSSVSSEYLIHILERGRMNSAHNFLLRLSIRLSGKHVTPAKESVVRARTQLPTSRQLQYMHHIM